MCGKAALSLPAMNPKDRDEKDRLGEIRAAIDPARVADDAKLVFIGRARTPWTTRDDCPKNLRAARERGGQAWLEIDAPWRPGLNNLKVGDAIIVLTWFDRARRNLLIQAPQHRPEPAGVFAIRSPVRPNPIGLHVVALLGCDLEAGRLEVDALDCLDKTPILDIKPWRAGVDIPPSAGVGR
jgi:tRNA (adenine37-N6)-methyltransferase